MPESNNKFQVSSNGDCFSVQNTITLTGCLVGVSLTLPSIPGASSEFVGNPSIGSYSGATWDIGDWCEGEQVYTFNWKFCITDIEQVAGTHSGLGITTTTQDVVDDSFEIIIEVSCPELETEKPSCCEEETVEEICPVIPISCPPKKVQTDIFIETISETPIKIKSTKSKPSDKCDIADIEVG